MKDYLQLIRVKHWIKNILIFVPIICAREVNVNNIIKILLAFVSFSLMASFVYILNDIKDLEKDKLHSKKKHRPLPSGRITIKNSIIIAVILFTLSIILNILINGNIFNYSFCFLIVYALINVAYSFGLKNIVIIDVFLLAMGFILRIYYGASIVNIEVSNWLFLTILNGSLFLGLGKRKKEIIQNKNSRKVLQEYNESFLDKLQYLTLGQMLVFYSLWSIEQDVDYLFLTIPFIMIIFMRYSLIIEKSDEGDPTTILYQDKFMIILCIIYGVSMLILLGGIW